MPTPQGKASVTETWMNRLTDLLASPDKNLDQVKKSVKADLEKLKREREVGSIAITLYSSAENGFKKDLEEVGVMGDAQKEYLASFKGEWDKMEMDKKTSEILASPELAAMDGFIINIQNLPKLKAIIDSANPESNWRTMLTGFASKIPGLGSFLENGGFDTILTSVGLGFLAKPKKDAAKKDTTKPAEKKDEGQKADEKKDKKEDKEVQRKTPGSTLFMGDSITVAMPSEGKSELKINGTIETIAKGGMSSGWGKGEAARWASEKRPKPPENAVILFGTNDLLGSAETIIKNLQDIYSTLYKAGVKRIYAVTIPPHQGYAMYDRSPKANETRHAVNDWLRGEAPNRPKPQYVHHLMDTCKEEKDGGLAQSGNPERLHKDFTGDNLHIVKKELAKFYQRELEIGSAEPDKKYD